MPHYLLSDDLFINLEPHERYLSVSDVFMVGPITPAKAAALPGELEQFMQDSGDHGVVVISFGGVLSDLDEAVAANILMAITRIKQKFIWKVKRKLYTS